MLKPTLQTSRLLPVALVSLGLLLASPAGAAAMTEPERCNWKADKVENRYSKCLSRSTTRLSNVLSGSTLDEDFHCAEQFHRSMDVIERRATFKDVGAECEARLTPESQACTQAAALIVAERDLDDYRPQFDDLTLEDLSCSPIQAYLQQSYRQGCAAAGGTWENDACTPAPPASSYNCFIAGFCSYTAEEYAPDVWEYANAYVGDTRETEPARGAGCNVEPGSSAWVAGEVSSNYQCCSLEYAPPTNPLYTMCE